MKIQAPIQKTDGTTEIVFSFRGITGRLELAGTPLGELTDGQIVNVEITTTEDERIKKNIAKAMSDMRSAVEHLEAAIEQAKESSE